MIYVADVKNGIVQQVVVASDDHEPAPNQIIIGPENTVGIGWSWDGDAFIPPDPDPDPDPEPDDGSET